MGGYGVCVRRRGGTVKACMRDWRYTVNNIFHCGLYAERDFLSCPVFPHFPGGLAAYSGFAD